jgi:hypothetical protein
VDFAEAERRAAAEAERIRQLGYDREREEAEAQAAREAAALELKNKSTAASTSGSNPVSAGVGSADVDKLGTGMKRLGFGALPRAQPAEASKTCVLTWRILPTMTDVMPCALRTVAALPRHLLWTTRPRRPAIALGAKRRSRVTCFSNGARMIQPPFPRVVHGWRSSRALRPFRLISISGVRKKRRSRKQPMVAC